MHYKDNLVSVITPVYNSEKFIEKTIESVLNQTYEDFEYILINDKSTDNSEKIIRNYMKKDSRIKLINLEKNSGAAIARNRGIELSQGKYIAFIDSDDFWKKDKLKKQIDFMKKNNYYFTFTAREKINEKGETIKISNVPKEIDYKKELRYNLIGTSTVVYDQQILGKIYMPNLRKAEDYAMWLKILKISKKGYGLNEILSFYLVRKDSLSSNKLSLIKYDWEMYRKSEEFGIIKSSFYLFTNIMSKILKIK